MPPHLVVVAYTTVGSVCSSCLHAARTCIQRAGASSRYACEPCPDGVTSAEGSDVCDLQLANSRRWLVIYLVVGASTLAGICVAYYTWSKKGAPERTCVGATAQTRPLARRHPINPSTYPPPYPCVHAYWYKHAFGHALVAFYSCANGRCFINQNRHCCGAQEPRFGPRRPAPRGAAP